MSNSQYLKLMEAELSKISAMDKKPKLLLHSCCAPCSSSVLELLEAYFEISVYYYNPNIFPKEEYTKRAKEQEEFCKSYFEGKNIRVICEDYTPKDFEEISRGKEALREGGDRCTECYRQRLEKTAKTAKENGFDYFASTLSVSPLKDAVRLNKIGEELSRKYGVGFLHNDFKKNDGYKRSCEISKKLGIYRQDWCGCEYSKRQRYIDSAKGYIFDLDGTLTDTMTYYETFSPNLVRHFGKVPEIDLRDKVRRMTTEEVVVYLVERYNLDATPDELLKIAYDDFERFYGSEARLKYGVKEFLEYAQKRGKKLCIASATTTRYIELVLKANGIYDMFEFILSCPDLKMYKNKPDIYYKAAQDMGLGYDEVIVFEDAHHAIKTARDGGLKTVAVYDENAVAFEDCIKEWADIYVDNMSELIFK